MNQESHFIHDLLTPLSVAQAHLRTLRNALTAEPPQAVEPADLKRRIERSFDAVERLVAMVSARRTLLSERLPAEPEAGKS